MHVPCFVGRYCQQQAAMTAWVLGVYKVVDVEAAVASYELSRETRERAGQKSYRVYRVRSAPGENKVGTAVAS